MRTGEAEGVFDSASAEAGRDLRNRNPAAEACLVRSTTTAGAATLEEGGAINCWRRVFRSVWHGISVSSAIRAGLLRVKSTCRSRRRSSGREEREAREFKGNFRPPGDQPSSFAYFLRGLAVRGQSGEIARKTAFMGGDRQGDGGGMIHRIGGNRTWGVSGGRVSPAFLTGTGGRRR